MAGDKAALTYGFTTGPEIDACPRHPRFPSHHDNTGCHRTSVVVNKVVAFLGWTNAR